MIEQVHVLLIRWASWVRVEKKFGGYGKLVIAKVMEGRGEILPSAPFNPSAIDWSEEDREMMEVERILAKMTKGDKRIVKVFYLTLGSAEDKAKYLRMSRRGLYGRLHVIHSAFTVAHFPGKL